MSKKISFMNATTERTESEETSSLLLGSESAGYGGILDEPRSSDHKPPSARRRSQNIIANQFLSAINDRRSNFRQNGSLIILLAVNTLERFAFYGLVCNYVLYLNKYPLSWESYNASTMLLIFFGISYVSSVLGGWVADSLLGKYTTICLSYVIYIIGYAVFPLISSHPDSVPNYCSVNGSVINWIPILKRSSDGYMRSIAQESCSWVIILSAVTIGVAVGFTKANLGPFGADQVISRGQSMVFKYFNWLYWCTNLGSITSFSTLAFIQQNNSFFVGFIIPFAALVLSFLLFLSEAFKSLRRKKTLEKQKQREREYLTESGEEDENENEAARLTITDSTESMLKSISWLDNAKIRYGGRFDDDLVDDVKALKKIIILFAILIPYWIVYFQVETTYIVQGLHMKLFSPSPTNMSQQFMVPTAWLSIADQLTVLMMIPLLESLVYPFMRKHFRNFFCENTRLVVGMAMSAMSVIVAGLLESYRLDLIQSNQNIIVQVIDNTTYYAADLHISWQIPQYVLVGMGEVFCSVSCLYYAYSAAPKSMQSLIMGLFYYFTGMGSFVGSVIISALASFIYSSTQNDDINCPRCHLNYYFYIIAVLQIVGMCVFICLDTKLSTNSYWNESEPCGDERTQSASASSRRSLFATSIKIDTTDEIPPAPDTINSIGPTVVNS